MQRQGKGKDVRASAATSGLPTEEIETNVALIQVLIPFVGEALEAEVVALAGARLHRTGGQAGVVRWGKQRGSVYLAAQKLPILVPRVRDRASSSRFYSFTSTITAALQRDDRDTVMREHLRDERRDWVLAHRRGRAGEECHLQSEPRLDCRQSIAQPRTLDDRLSVWWGRQEAHNA